VERGIKGISADKIEKFSEIINNRNEYKLEEMTLIQKAKDWFDKTDLTALIEQMGYQPVELAYAMGISSAKVRDYRLKHENRISDAGKLEFYFFLTNENNRKYNQTIKTEKQNVEEERVIENTQLHDIEDIRFSEATETTNKTTDIVNIEEIRNKLKLLESINDKLAQENEQKEKEIKLLYEAKNKASKQLQILEVRCQAYENYIMNK
jgi:DNA-binding transcriptional regulator YiaG